MKLHEDKYSFLNIIGLVHEVSGIREDIIMFTTKRTPPGVYT